MDSAMTTALIGELLYGIDKVASLRDPDTQARFAEFIIDRRYFPGTVEEYSEAIGSTVRQGRLATATREISTRFSETELLAFLSEVGRLLDERRPWPRPSFVKTDISRWEEFSTGRAVAEIHRPTMDIEGLLNASFDEVSVGDDRIPVMILELRTGDVVALLGSVLPRSMTFTLLRREAGGAAELIARFCDLTGFASDEVIPLADEP